MSLTRQRVVLALVAAVACAMAISGVALSATSAEITACVNGKGAARFVDDADECKRKEEAVTWNARGARGPKGEPGEPGAKGDTGPQGLAGPAGAQGDRGPGGSAGDRGPAGSQGDRGLVGPTGDRGAPGQTGGSGPTGMPGDVGPTGPTGDRGPTGDAATDLPLWVDGDQTSTSGTGSQVDTSYRVLVDAAAKWFVERSRLFVSGTVEWQQMTAATLGTTVSIQCRLIVVDDPQSGGATRIASPQGGPWEDSFVEAGTGTNAQRQTFSFSGSVLLGTLPSDPAARIGTVRVECRNTSASNNAPGTSGVASLLGVTQASTTVQVLPLPR